MDPVHNSIGAAQSRRENLKEISTVGLDVAYTGVCISNHGALIRPPDRSWASPSQISRNLATVSARVLVTGETSVSMSLKNRVMATYAEFKLSKPCPEDQIG